MKTIAKFRNAALLLMLAGVVGTTSTGNAQNRGAEGLPAQVGQVITCNFQGPIAINRDGEDFVGAVSGYGSFQVVDVGYANDEDAAAGRVSRVTYVPVDIQATSTFEALGTFTTRLNDVSVTSETVALGGADIFPVQSDMIYYPIVDTPYGSYTTQEPVNFTSGSANSFLPFENEPFHLAGPVTFSGDDGNTFTLVRLDAIFNH